MSGKPGLNKELDLLRGRKAHQTRYTKQFQKFQNLKSNPELVAWLCGLISSDGCVYQAKDKYLSTKIELVSAEKDWADFIVKQLKQIEIECSKTTKWRGGFADKICYKIHLRNPFYCFLVINEFNRYLMPRKFRLLEKKFRPILEEISNLT